MKKLFFPFVIFILFSSCETTPKKSFDTKETNQIISTVSDQNEEIKKANNDAKEEIKKTEKIISVIKETGKITKEQTGEIGQNISVLRGIIDGQSVIIDNQKKSIGDLKLQHEKDNASFGVQIAVLDKRIEKTTASLNGFKKYSLIISIIAVALLAVIVVPILRKLRILP